MRELEAVTINIIIVIYKIWVELVKHYSYNIINNKDVH